MSLSRSIGASGRPMLRSAPMVMNRALYSRCVLSSECYVTTATKISAFHYFFPYTTAVHSFHIQSKVEFAAGTTREWLRAATITGLKG